jgi:hypothetical protein
MLLTVEEYSNPHNENYSILYILWSKSAKLVYKRQKHFGKPRIESLQDEVCMIEFIVSSLTIFLRPMIEIHIGYT